MTPAVENPQRKREVLREEIATRATQTQGADPVAVATAAADTRPFANKREATAALSRLIKCGYFYTTGDNRVRVV